MKRISLIAGHNPKGKGDVGASGNGFNEGDLTVRLRDKIKAKLEKLGARVIVDNDSWNLQSTINGFSSWIKPSEIIIDIHWNASVHRTATGTEVLIPMNPTFKETELAMGISKIISDTLDIVNRGIKTEDKSARGRLGFMRIPAENILIEVCFISNKSDMDKYFKFEDILVEKLSNYIYNYA